MIYRKAEHEALVGGAWDERRARFAIADVVDDVSAAGPPDENGIYAGAAGETYALRLLGRDVDWPLGPGDGAGYVDGELGIALVARDVDRFRAAAGECIADDWIELLYGAAGALVGARLLGLDDVAREAIRRLWSTWSFDSKLRSCIWTQREPRRQGRAVARHRTRSRRQRLRTAQGRAAAEPRPPDGAHASRDRDAPAHGSPGTEAPQLAA